MSSTSTAAMEHPVTDRRGAAASEAETSSALVVLGLVAALGLVSPERVGLDLGANGETWRAFTLALALPGAWLLAFDRRALSALARPAMLPLAAALAWVVVTSPFGGAPLSDAVTAIGLASFAGFAAWAAVVHGWDAVIDVVGLALGVFIVASILAPAVDSGARLEGRLQGLAIHPNELGLACVIAIGAGLSAVSRRRRHAPWLLIASVVALVASDSRTSFIAAVIVVSVWARPVLGRAVPLVVGAAGLAAIAVVLATGSTAAVSETAGRTGEATEISSANGRVEVWDASLDLVNAEPVTGYGANSTADALDGLVAWRADHPHNMLLQMGMHGGWPALLLTLVAFAAYWRLSRLDPRPDRDAVVVGVFVVGLTEAVIRRPNAAIVVLAAALASVPSFGRQRTHGAQLLRPSSPNRTHLGSG